MKKTKSVFLRIIALSLVLVLAVPVTASASGDDGIMPHASYYLDAYNTYLCYVDGNIQIWFEVAGTGYMDDIGALSIILYEVKSDGSLSQVKTFLHEDYPSMLAHHNNYIYSHVSCPGSSSKTYKAQVCIWAGKNGDGDSRYMWAT